MTHLAIHDSLGNETLLKVSSQRSVNMDTTTLLRHKNGKIIRATKELDYLCANDLEQFLGLGRINTRAMDTCKIKVLDRGGDGLRANCSSTRTTCRVCYWEANGQPRSAVQDIILGPQELPKPKPEPTPNNPNRLSAKVQSEVKEVIENWWTRIPRPACEQLENAVGLEGLTKSLREEDIRLRKEYNEQKNSANWLNNGCA